MSKTSKLTTYAVFIAIGVIGSSFLSIPIGPYRALFVQHALNIIISVWFGTKASVSIAFTTGLLRNLMGLGTIFAFPGGMSGALLAGLMYRYTGKKSLAMVGELFGTTVIGGLLSVPISQLLTGEAVFVFAFIPGFFISSAVGTAVAGLILYKIDKPHTYTP